jgi:trypsin-like peptidase
MYCDLRLYGTERWSLTPPEDAQMWIPQSITATVCFLCVEDKGKMLYGGTAFFVSKEEEICPDLKWGYIVTAKHCVEQAFSRYGNLSCRMNVKGGGVKFVALPDHSEWSLPDDADVAVLPFDYDNTTDMQFLPPKMLITDEIMKKEDIGLGDEVFMVGLFREVYGKKKNFPILRSGTISSIPDEAFQDPDTGRDYRALLIEVRSISGLSGSPVFMALKRRGVEMHHPPRGFHAMTHSMLLLGMIRGHWDTEMADSLTDFGTGKIERLNTGIAIVTPIQEVDRILMSDEFKKQRKAEIREYEKKRAPTPDSGFPNAEPVFTKNDFEGALRKASRILSDEK